MSTKSGSDRRGREEGDSEESTDRGHREGFEMDDEECLRGGFLIVALDEVGSIDLGSDGCRQGQ